MLSVQLGRNFHSSGDAVRLLDLFCDYQADLEMQNLTSHRRWDHALLFTG